MKTYLYLLLFHWIGLPIWGQNAKDLYNWRICAESALELEEYKQALTCYKNLYQFSQSADSLGLYAVRIGDVYQKMSMGDSALYWIEQPKKGANLSNQQAAYLVQGQAFALKTQYEAALSSLDTLETLLTNSPNINIQILAFGEKVNVYIRQNKLGEADSLNKLAINLAEQQLGKVQPLQIYLLANAGIIARRNNQPKEAMAYFNQALIIAQQLGLQKTSSLARLQVNIGNLLVDNTMYEKAIWHYEKSLTISQQIYGTQHNLAGIAHRGLATAYRHQGNFTKSLQHFKFAFGIFSQISGEKSSNVANIYSGMGVCYYQSDKYAAAIECFEKSLNIINNIYAPNHIDFAILYSNMASIYAAIDQEKSAIEFYQKALDIYIEQSGKYAPRVIATYISLAEVALTNPDTAQAYGYISKSFAGIFQDDSLKFENLALLSKLTKQRLGSIESEEFQNALKVYARYLLQQYERSQDLAYLQKGHLVAQIYIDFTKHIEEEFAELKDRIAFAKTVSQALESFARINAILYQHSGKKEYLESLLNLMEKNKAIALLENTQTDALSRAAGLPDSWRDKEHELHIGIKKYETELMTAQLRNEVEKIQSLRIKLATLMENYDQFKTELKANYEEYYQNRYGHLVVKMDSLRANLAADQWLFEYLEGESYTLAVAVSKAKVLVKIIPLSNYKIPLIAFRSYLNGIPINDQNNSETVAIFAQSAQVLYKELLQFAFDSFAQSPKSIVIVPDGRLSSISFEALIATLPTDKQMRWDSLDYLIKNYPISYAYSATFWHKNNGLKVAKKSYRQMLAMAAAYDLPSPSYREDYLKDIRKNLGQLPGVQQEIKSLKASRWAGRFVYGNKCSEKNFKKQAEGYQIIHLAMHGLLDKQQPTLSTLAFSESQDSVEDNFLYVYEIMNMKFTADLVVLSACETGSGEFQQGAGVVSAGYAFSYAGVPAVVTSLWAVNDQTTATIMQNFYQNLAAGMRKDEALQKAKLAYLYQASNLAAHPSLWAAFILTGNCNPIEYVSGFKWGALGYFSAFVIAAMSLYVLWVLINYTRLRWIAKVKI